MVVERPTFHESWYRVAQLRPRLLSSVKIYRQHFRGRMWYVLENASSNEFTRISSDSYHYIGMLDGKRTVAEAWHICNDKYADQAPTQSEIIQLLGQLYSLNLLYAELSPDTESLLNRYNTRIKRQVQSFLASILFARIPLLDPDHILNAWVGVFGWLFSWVGMILWLIVIGTGLYFVVGNISELIYQSNDILAPDNLIFLYLSIVFIKICHEFGHACACKSFGKRSGGGGEVHVMGIMFLVFVPLPYVDASSAWAFRKKWHRAVVGMSGVMVELVIASIAAVIWVRTSTGTLHIIAYNVLFIASVSTLFFNANPLLRFDGYYVLSDIIEIPNLSQRFKNYFYYLVKKYYWGLKHLHNPASTIGERLWFVFYGIASTFWRVYISVRILLFLNKRLPEQLSIVVPVFALSAIIAWVFVPIGRFIRYLAISNELARNRFRAVTSTFVALGVLIFCVGIINVPDYCRVEGIVEPINLAVVHAESDGFLVNSLSSVRDVNSENDELIETINPDLEAQSKSLAAQMLDLQARRRIAETKDVASVQILTEQIEALSEKIDKTKKDLSSLNLKPTLAGTWISKDIENAEGLYLRRGEQIGIVADLNDLMIRATAKQETAALLIENAYDEVAIRVKGRPDVLVPGQIEKIYPAGQEILPSQALGYAVGGSMQTTNQDPRGIKTTEKFFEIRIKPVLEEGTRLFSGQRVIVRIRMPSKSLSAQWWRSLRQLFQRRFHI